MDWMFFFFFLGTGILKEANEQAPSKLESARHDVDQDVFLMFNVVDENLSWYLDDNVQNCSDPAGVDMDDPEFEESNLMHGDFFSSFLKCFLTQLHVFLFPRTVLLIVKLVFFAPPNPFTNTLGVCVSSETSIYMLF